MGRQEVLYKDQVISLDSNGGATITFGPAKRGETWRIDRMFTSGSSAVEPEVNVYRGSIAPNAKIDFTPFGSDDISETTTELRLQDNERLIIVYSGGTSGGQMTYRLEGLVEYRDLGGGYSAI